MEIDARVYISGPLTYASDIRAARGYYERLARLCRQQGFDPYLPHTENDPELHPGRTPEAVFQDDIRELLEAKIVLAYVGLPSLGVGAELAVAALNKIPIVAIRRPGDKVSRFVLGMLSAHNAIDLVAPDECLDDELPRALRSATVSGAAGGFSVG